jgi:pimeloyl-ACP methyl ester carboxylesterase
MKHLLLALLLSVSAAAQRPAYFNQSIDVSAYPGAAFTFEAKVFGEREDDESSTAIVILGLAGKKHISSNLGGHTMDHFKADEWNRLTITGTIDRRCNRLEVGAVYSGRAVFYYDDLVLTVKDKSGTHILPLENAGFENTDVKPWTFGNTPKGTSVSVTTLQAAGGKQSLMIDGMTDSPSGQFADINGVKIYYEISGEGEPVLLLHGALENHHRFQQQITAWTKNRKVIAVDTRGHGKSTLDATTLTYELYAKDMNALLDQLQTGPVNIVGWSDGGITGILMARDYPEKVKSVVAMGANLSNDGIVDSLNEEMRTRLKQLEKTDPNGLEARVNRCMLTEPNIDPASLSKIHCPVLVIAGEKDVIVESHTRLIAASIPGSRLLILKGQTHDAPIEAPYVFIKAVEDFWKQK